MKPRYELAGRFDEHVIESGLLEGNPLGDPHMRPLWVYLPLGYEATYSAIEYRYPLAIKYLAERLSSLTPRASKTGSTCCSSSASPVRRSP